MIETVNVVIVFSHGMIQTVKTFVHMGAAESFAIDYAREHFGIEATDIGDMAEKFVGTGNDIQIYESEYTDGECYQDKDYKYNGQCLSLDELRTKLAIEGYKGVGDLEDYDFRLWVKARQSKDKYFYVDYPEFAPIIEGQLPDPIDGLLIKFYASYRGGEKERVVYATTEEEAIGKVCDWNEHYDMWEIEEE